MTDLRASITEDANPEGNNQYTGGEGRKKLDSQDREHVNSLASAVGGSRYEFNNQLEDNGYFHLSSRDHKDTPEARKVLKEMKDRGWTIHGSDKGAFVVPPWTKF